MLFSFINHVAVFIVEVKCNIIDEHYKAVQDL